MADRFIVLGIARSIPSSVGLRKGRRAGTLASFHIPRKGFHDDSLGPRSL